MKYFWDLAMVIVGVLSFFLSTSIWGEVEGFAIFGIIFIGVGLFSLIIKIIRS